MGRAHEVNPAGIDFFRHPLMSGRIGIFPPHPSDGMAGCPVKGKIERNDGSEERGFPAVFHGNPRYLMSRLRDRDRRF